MLGVFLNFWAFLFCSWSMGSQGLRPLFETHAQPLGLTKGWFPKGWFWRMFPRNENRNEGTFGCSPGTTKNQNEGTFGCSPGAKTGTRAHSPKPPFYETALLSPSDLNRYAIVHLCGILGPFVKGNFVAK